ncbi:MAG TPA: hypothetical protein VLB27_00425, partial [candidate division Zixibacteria bacterium]|nr:hypothetical protein [candidate division Zixibacteria bacterium]
FVITGRNTFSAASHLVTYLETFTNALFVGEPMGGSPNHYGDAPEVTLPNSGILARFSSLYWQNSTPFDSRRVHGPDLYAPMTSQDYFNNSDPALTVIANYRPQSPLMERVVDALESGDGGYEMAEGELLGFLRDPLHQFLDLENELNQFGYGMIEGGRTQTALSIFRLNCSAYPESFNTWDSYAECLAGLGDTTAAITNYRKSLQLNPDNQNAERMIEQLTRR